jgi:hypothetical protein
LSSLHVGDPSSMAGGGGPDGALGSPRGGEAGLYWTFVAATLLAALLGAALFWPRTGRSPLESTHFGALPPTNVLMLDEPAPMR